MLRLMLVIVMMTLCLQSSSAPPILFLCHSSPLFPPLLFLCPSSPLFPPLLFLCPSSPLFPPLLFLCPSSPLFPPLPLPLPVQGKDAAGVKPLVYPVTVVSKVQTLSRQPLMHTHYTPTLSHYCMSSQAHCEISLHAYPSLTLSLYLFYLRFYLSTSHLTQVKRSGAPDALDRLQATRYVQVESTPSALIAYRTLFSRYTPPYLVPYETFSTFLSPSFPRPAVSDSTHHNSLCILISYSPYPPSPHQLLYTLPPPHLLPPHTHRALGASSPLVTDPRPPMTCSKRPWTRVP
jgi:hypothetical protein